MTPKRPAFLYLRALARLVLARRKPFVLGVTGTAGKTTACAAARRCLEAAFPGRVAPGGRNYNGEWGLPLTVLFAETPGRNPFAWLALAARAVRLAFFGKYPEYLVLEYGIDRPGEMADLLSVARPDAGALCGVSPNHAENFSSYAEYFAGKASMLAASRLKACDGEDSQLDGLPADIRYRRAGRGSGNLSARVEHSGAGLSFRLEREGEVSGIIRTEFFGSYNALPLMAGASLALLAGAPLDKVAEGLSGISPEPGRGRALAGLNGAKIVDGSYNGGPASVAAGLASLAEGAAGRPAVLLLGDMRELGEEERPAHLALVEKIAALAPESVVLVGPLMAAYVLPGLSAALPGKVRHFLSSRAAGDWVRRELLEKNPGCRIIFAKGSQNTVFLEEAVARLLADPRDAAKLCRSSPSWAAKKEKFFQSLPQ